MTEHERRRGPQATALPDRVNAIAAEVAAPAQRRVTAGAQVVGERVQRVVHAVRSRAGAASIAVAVWAALLFVAVWWFAVVLVAVMPFTVDDAFITFRYGRNLAAGFGPTFNPGGVHAEGYTTFLWMLVSAVPHLLGQDVVAFSKVVGVLAMLGAIVAAAWLSADLLGRIEGVRRPIRLLGAAVAAILMAAFPATAAHAVSGMETALFTLLLTLFLVYGVRLADHYSTRGAALLFALGLATGLTRPEGNLVVGLVAVGLAIQVPSERRSQLLALGAMVYVLPGSAYFAWRAAYYGQLLPLPFYVKTGSGLRGAPDVLSFVWQVVVPMAVLALPGWWYTLRRSWPLVVGATSLMAFFLVPEHMMGFDWRYLFPVMPPLAALAGVGAGGLVLRGVRRRSGPSIGRALWIAGLTIIVGVALARPVGEMVGNSRVYADGLTAAHVALGKQLAREGGAPGDVLAIGDAGAVPYYSGWETVDTFGLNDPAIALSGSHDAAYVLDRNPRVLVLISSSPEQFDPPLSWEADLYREAMKRGFAVTTHERFGSNYWLWVLSPPS